MNSVNILRSTKIVSTLGPSTSSENKIKSLIKSGVNVFRLNFSHGSHNDHLQIIKIIRKIESQLSIQIGILADLQGPKFRIGTVKDNVKLKLNNTFVLDQNKSIGCNKRVF